MLPLGSAERIEPALSIYRKFSENLDEDESIGFCAATAREVDPAGLWLWAERTATRST